MRMLIKAGLVSSLAIVSCASGAIASTGLNDHASGTIGDTYHAGGIQSQEYQQVSAAVEFIRGGRNDRALTLLKQLEVKGFAPAMTLLGSMYAAGRGVYKSDVRASQLYADAAALGDPAAMYLYGYALDNGIGVRQNKDAAILWLQRASDSGKIELQKAVRAYRERATG